MEENERDVPLRRRAATARGASNDHRRAIRNGAWKIEDTVRMQRDGTVVTTRTTWYAGDRKRQSWRSEAGRRAPEWCAPPGAALPPRTALPPRHAVKPAAAPKRRSSTSAQRRSAIRSAAHHARLVEPGGEEPMCVEPEEPEPEEFHDAIDFDFDFAGSPAKAAAVHVTLDDAASPSATPVDSAAAAAAKLAKRRNHTHRDFAPGDRHRSMWRLLSAAATEAQHEYNCTQGYSAPGGAKIRRRLQKQALRYARRKHRAGLMG